MSWAEKGRESWLLYLCYFTNISYLFAGYLDIQKRPSYSKTCVKRPLKHRQNKDLMTNGSLMKVESIAECFMGAFCYALDLH